MKVERGDRRLLMFQEIEKGGSGEEIAEKAGVSRTAVWKFVRRLEELGYEVEVDRKRGYRLVSSPDPSPLHMALAALKIPGVERYYHFEEVDSTNRFAKEVSNAVVFSESQSSGRGRLGRRWESERGGVYMSLSLNMSIPVSEIPKVTLLSGLAVCRALEEYGARIKWPNDVLVGGKKVSGILSEFVGEEMAAKVVVGIGVNVRNRVPDALRDRAISLHEVDGNVRITDIFTRICEQLSNLLSAFPQKWGEILEEWKRLSDTIGREVRVSLYGEEVVGKAVDVDTDGGLIVVSGEGRRKVISGECFYTNY
ncbi:MAG: biotin--[acetyl-CoA-carboxylase] ligase [Archaeoglobi archaeon]|nr:biotin--[acetyl-CoA-carboxylase] ligase [Archaeoglobi archaeon]